MFIIYKIYYVYGLVYIGRTKQKLQDRLRGHFFKKKMMREIDIDEVVGIEYAELETEADMNVYEVYLINKYKPYLNKDDKAHDELTIEIPEPEFHTYDCPLMYKWKQQIIKIDNKELENRNAKIEHTLRVSEARRKHKNGEIAYDEYLIIKDASNINGVNDSLDCLD